MRLTFFSFVLFLLSTNLIKAQTSAQEDENYKHARKVHKHHSTTMESDNISLRNQKTQKSQQRKYIVAPTDSLPNSNIQGKKNRGNYKNQFN
jgi:hypothetical protein